MENYVLCEEGIPLNWYSLLQRVTCKIALAFEVILEYGITEDTDLPTAKRGRIHPFKMGLNANWLYKETQCRTTVCSPKHCLWCRFLCLEKQAMGFLPVKTFVVAISVMPPKQFRMLMSQILWQKLFYWKLHYYSPSPWKFVIDQSAVPKSVLRFVCVCLPFVESFLYYVCLPCEKKDLFPIRFIGIFFCVFAFRHPEVVVVLNGNVKCKQILLNGHQKPKHFWK